MFFKKTMKRYLAFAILPFLVIPAAHAEHVLELEAFGQFLDISQLESEKFTFEFDDTSYDIYYGYSGSLDDSFTEHVTDPIVADMSVNQERKSIQVVFETVPTTTDFWVRIPVEILTAEKEEYQVLIDGQVIGYDLMKMPDGYVVGMILPEDTKQVEIIGTHVIPEFGRYAVLILGMSVIGLVFFARKFSFGNSLPRIN